MFSTDFVCCHFKTWDQTEGTGQTVKGVRWSTLTFLMSIYFHIWMLRGCVMLSLDLHIMSADKPWPSLQVSWSALTLWLSIYGILRGVSCSYTLKDQIIISKPWKCMEISIHTSTESGWWGNTIPMVWSIICIHIKWAFHRGARWVNLPYIWDQMQGIYIGHLDLHLLIIYRAIPEKQVKTTVKPIHQNIVWILLTTKLGHHDLIRPPMIKLGHPDLIKAKLGSFGV